MHIWTWHILSPILKCNILTLTDHLRISTSTKQFLWMIYFIAILKNVANRTYTGVAYWTHCVWASSYLNLASLGDQIITYFAGWLNLVSNWLRYYNLFCLVCFGSIFHTQCKNIVGRSVQSEVLKIGILSQITRCFGEYLKQISDFGTSLVFIHIKTNKPLHSYYSL